jgi:hypothetical protein
MLTSQEERDRPSSRHLYTLSRTHIMTHGLTRWHDPAIMILNDFLRSERDAVAAYARVIGAQEYPVIPELPRCLLSHRKRVEMLRLWIIHEGGYPTADSTAWEFYRMTDGFDDHDKGPWAILIALELGEKHVTGVYRAGLDVLDEKTQRLITFAIVPEQVRMLKILNVMKHSIR